MCFKSRNLVISLKLRGFSELSSGCNTKVVVSEYQVRTTRSESVSLEFKTNMIMCVIFLSIVD